MQDSVNIQIPCEWLKGLPQEELTYKHIVRLGIRQLKIERAIQLYLAGVGSPGYIAGQLELGKQDLIKEMRLRNIEPAVSNHTLQEELAS